MAAIVNNQTKEKEQQEEGLQKPSISLTQGGGAAPTPGAPAPMAGTPANAGVGTKPASSGRFTNLQSYLGANKGAGEKIAGVVGQGITKNLGQQKTAESKEAEQFRNAVQSAQGVNQQGQAAVGQISDPNFDPNAIAGNADALKQFTDLRTGTAQQAAGEAAQKEGNEAQNALTGLQQAYGKTTQQIQDPNARFSLLQQYLASPKTQYGRGLSSLDNALLQSDPSKSLQNMNKQITQEQKTIGKERADMLSQQQSQSQVAKEQGTKLAEDIQSKTIGNEQSMVKGLEDKIAGENAARAQKQTWANDQYKKLQSGDTANLDPAFIQMLGLKQGQRTYGTFQNMQDPSELLSMSPAQITSINQLATDQDRARYGALAQLAGIDKSGYRVGDAVAIDPAVGLNSNLDLAKRITDAQSNLEASTLAAGGGSSGGSLNQITDPNVKAALQSGDQAALTAALKAARSINGQGQNVSWYDDPMKREQIQNFYNNLAAQGYYSKI